MKQKKQTNENPRWLVAVKEKNSRKKNHLFGFLTKRDALGFIKDISKDDVEWAIADARGNA
jgi:hypothetical protein